MLLLNLEPEEINPESKVAVDLGFLKKSAERAPNRFVIMQKTAFSVAEAMIMLLIASIVLGVFAPLISKNIKNNTMNQLHVSDIPSGAVMFFRLSKCPSGWSKLPAEWDSRYIEISAEIGVKSGEEVLGEPVIPYHKHFLGVGVTPTDGGRDKVSCYTINDVNNPDLNCTGNPLDTMAFGNHTDRNWPRITRRASYTGAYLEPNYALSSVPVNDTGEKIATGDNDNKPKHVRLLACEKD